MSLADHFCADEVAGVFAYRADALTALRTLPDNYVHTIITDPPYGLGDAKPYVVAAAITAWATGDRERVPDGRGFMGRRWDAFVPPPAVWDECLRVLKPGGHLAVFAGSRTADLMGLSIRLAGFDMRDGISAWLYGSGFPKSLDVGKAIDKAGGDPLAFRRFAAAYAAAIEASDHTHADIDRALGIKASSCYWSRTDHRGGLPPRHHWTQVRDLLGLDAALERLYDEAEREVLRTETRMNEPSGIVNVGQGERSVVDRKITAPATDAARAWSGWGTALKPAWEPILMARKPLEGTVAANTLAHGCGGLNVDACRVDPGTHVRDGGGGQASARRAGIVGEAVPGNYSAAHDAGRWPTNVLLAHAPELDPVTGEVVGDACADGCVPGCHVRQLDEQSGRVGGERASSTPRQGAKGDGWRTAHTGAEYSDSGGASRFYPTFRYTAKAGKRERPQAWGAHPDCACEPSRPLDPETGALPPWHRRGTVCATCERPATYRGHPTVKPQGLLEWLVALLTPTAEQLGEGATGTVLDVFAGSGSLGEAARTVGVGAVLVERDVHSARLIARRLGVDEPQRDPTVAPLYASSVTQPVVELRRPEPFDLVVSALMVATTPAQLDAARHSPAWAPEHDALAALLLAQLTREEAA